MRRNGPKRKRIQRGCPVRTLHDLTDGASPMHIVEIPLKRSRDFRRLARATALLCTGIALHVWLFPAPAGEGLFDGVAGRFVKIAAEQAIGTSGAEAGVIASGLGEMRPASARDSAASQAPAVRGTRASRPRASRVKVVVERVQPTVVQPLIESQPGRFRNALLTTVRAPEPAVEPTSAEETVEEPTGDLPPLSDTLVSHAPGRTLREPRAPVMALTERPPVADLPKKTLSREAIRPFDTPSDERLVGDVLQQYRAAYESLDVSAAQNVWPTVDARALGAAFRQLAGQRVTFESCGVEVSGSGSQATARCTGQAEYVPKVGGRRAYTASGEWVFDLQKENAAWRIINANANVK